MKSKVQELVDRSIAAMISAIEIYNKPTFEYREETFSILAINSWEMCLKGKVLQDNKNRLNSIYVYEKKTNKNGTKSKKDTIKLTRSGNPFTHSLDYLGKVLVEKGTLDKTVYSNIEGLIEIRDNSIHFYNRSGLLKVRLQEIGMACIQNYVSILKEWFGQDLSEYNTYIMPMAFINNDLNTKGLILNHEEIKFYKFLDDIEKTEDQNKKYAVSLNIDVKFIRSKSTDAIKVAIGTGKELPEIRLTEEQILDKYPWTYADLVKACKDKYSDFKLTKRFHDIKRPFVQDRNYAIIRLLDPKNPRGMKKTLFSPNILKELDRFYTKNIT